MLRRRDVVELLSDTWARQESSVDISMPMTLRAITPARNGACPRYAVPVMLLPKIPPTMMNFHFRSGAERLTLPTRRQNGLASYAALLAAARAKLGWPLPKPESTARLVGGGWLLLWCGFGVPRWWFVSVRSGGCLLGGLAGVFLGSGERAVSTGCLAGPRSRRFVRSGEFW
jgi:hypothetical protein